MYRRYLIFVFMVAQTALAQTNDEKALANFNAGNIALKLGSFNAADSLFTVSLEHGKYADTYFNRGLARKKLNDEEGYCIDMMNSAKLGDIEASELHNANCGVNTTLQLNSQRQPTFDSSYVYTLKVSGLKYLKQLNYKIYDNIDSLVDYFRIVDLSNTARYQRDTIWIVREGKRLEIMPQYIGGDVALQKYLYRTLRYPQRARENGIEGTVVVQFVVDREGSVSNILVLRDIGGGTAEEAVRVIEGMGKWKPATIDGKPVPVYFKMPITFMLSSSDGSSFQH